MSYTVVIKTIAPAGVKFYIDVSPQDVNSLISKYNTYLGNGLVSCSFSDPSDPANTKTATLVFDDVQKYDEILTAIRALPEFARRLQYHLDNGIMDVTQA